MKLNHCNRLECKQLVEALRAAHPNTIAQWGAADEIERLDKIASELQDTCHKQSFRIAELEAVIQSHGIPVKTFAGGVPHYEMGNYQLQRK